MKVWQDRFPRFAYVVLGMHRSGTSALAGVLSICGADAPKTRMVPTQDNPKGYFESNAVRALNDRILTSAGSKWDDWSEIPAGWFRGPRAQAFRPEVQAVIEAEFGESPLFVLKDPRMCRIWPLWRDVLVGIGIRPLPILTLRNPDEVAASLHRRDGITPAGGRLIWLRHILDAERLTRGEERLVTSYDTLLTNWKSVLSEVEAFSKFTLPRRSNTTNGQIRDFLDPALRRFDAKDDLPVAPEGGLAQELMSLLDTASNSDPDTAAVRLDVLQKLLNDLNGTLFDLTDQLRDSGTQIAGLKADHNKLIAEHDELLADAEMQRQLDGARAEELTALRADHNKLISEHDELLADAEVQRQLDEARAEELSALRADQDKLKLELRVAIASRATATLELDAKAEALVLAEREAEEAQRQIAALQSNLTLSTANQDAHQRERDAALKSLEERMATIKDQHREMASIVKIAQKREAALEILNREAVAVERKRIQAEFRSTLSWRITRPLRWLRHFSRA